MIPVKDAVGRAVQFARTVLEPSRTPDLLLEEVEPATIDGKEVWLITLSMPSQASLGNLTGARDYKTFTLDGQTGEPISMKIREVVGAR